MIIAYQGIDKTMNEYAGVVCAITVEPHPNADRLQVGHCLGQTVVVDMQTKSGDVGVYFPSGGRLTPEYATAMGMDKFLNNTLRIRPKRLRGVLSDGLWLPLKGELIKHCIGEEITSVCSKYYTPAEEQFFQR